MRPGPIVVLWLAAASVALATPAAAQLISPFRGQSAAGLSKSDLALLTSTSDAVNNAGTAGAKTWSNPGTGNSGTVTLAGAFQSKGMQCHKLDYTVDFARPIRHSAFTLNWCRVAAGSWKTLD